MLAYTITQAKLTDVPMIKNLAEATWWPTYTGVISAEQISYMLEVLYSVETLAHQINSGEQTYLLLKEGDEAVAFAGYSVYDGDTKAYKLHKLYCLPKTQGKGYGKLLINTISDIATGNGASKLYLNVNRYNKALAFYQKMGFAVDHEVDIPFGQYILNDYVMVKGL